MLPDRVQQRPGVSAESQDSGIRDIILRPAGRHILLGDAQQNVQQASTDPGMGESFCLQRITKGTEAGEAVQAVADAV